MRKFYIEAENGLRVDLQSNKYFLHLPNGLGVKYDTAFSKVGEYYIKNSQELSQKVISGDLIFRNEYYKNYKSFIDFMSKYKKYSLVYAIENQEYYIDIVLNSIGKGDTQGKDYLSCPIEFSALSSFYKKITKTYALRSEANQNRWDISWSKGLLWQDATSGVLTVTNNGQSDSAWVIRINGACINPIITIATSDNRILEIPFNIELAGDEYIELSTIDNDLYCIKGTPTGTVNAFDILDFSNDNFIKLPIGENEITIASDIVGASLTLQEYYIGV